MLKAFKQVCCVCVCHCKQAEMLRKTAKECCLEDHRSSALDVLASQRVTLPPSPTHHSGMFTHLRVVTDVCVDERTENLDW